MNLRGELVMMARRSISICLAIAAVTMARPAHAGFGAQAFNAVANFFCAMFGTCGGGNGQNGGGESGPQGSGNSGGNSGPNPVPGGAPAPAGGGGAANGGGGGDGSNGGANPQSANLPEASRDLGHAALSRGDIPIRQPKVSPTTADLGDPKHTAVVGVDHGTTVNTDWGECVAVVNRRIDKQSISIPYLQRDEFDNFKLKAKENELELFPCYCQRPLSANDIHTGIQKLDANHSEPSRDLMSSGPQYGQEPDYYVDAITLGRLCELLACGTPTLLSSTKDADPDDNTRAVYVSSGTGPGVWRKLPAKNINRKIDHRRPTLSCALPPP